VDGVGVYRVPVRHLRAGKLRYLFEYGAAFVAMTALLARLHRRARYDVVQVNTMPDFLVFATLPAKWRGARVVLDLHECMPEIYRVKYDLGPGSVFVRLLQFLEQRAIAYADRVVTCNEQMRKIFAARGAPAEKIAVVLNSADDRIFTPPAQAARRSDDGFVLISHGSLEERYGLDLALEAVERLKERIPGLRLEIYGHGQDEAALIEQARRRGLNGHVSFQGFVPMERLVRALDEADVGLITMRQCPELRWVHTFKMFEFVAMRKPVVIPRSEAVEAYFDDSCFMFFESGDAADLARAVMALYEDAELRRALPRNAGRAYERYCWSAQASVYGDLIERVAGGGR
jgi:glycosyltransferase involved in cell wall biosynthesis